jgi:hypothetical protein
MLQDLFHDTLKDVSSPSKVGDLAPESFSNIARMLAMI